MNKDDFRRSLIDLAKVYTAQADLEFDEHGKVIKRELADNELGLQDTIVVDRGNGKPAPDLLIDVKEPVGRERKQRREPKPR